MNQAYNDFLQQEHPEIASNPPSLESIINSTQELSRDLVAEFAQWVTNQRDEAEGSGYSGSEFGGSDSNSSSGSSSHSGYDSSW